MFRTCEVDDVSFKTDIMETKSDIESTHEESLKSSDAESNYVPVDDEIPIPRIHLIKQESAADSAKVQKNVRAPLMIIMNFITIASAIWVVWQSQRWLTTYRRDLVNIIDLWFSPSDTNTDHLSLTQVPELMNSHGFAMILALCLFAPFAACSKVMLHCGWIGEVFTSVLWLMSVLTFTLGMVFWFTLDIEHGDKALPELSPDKGMHRILSVPIITLMCFGMLLFAIRMLAAVTISSSNHRSTAWKLTRFVMWVNNLFGDDLMSHHLRRFIPICAFLGLCSGLLTYHQIIFTAGQESNCKDDDEFDIDKPDNQTECEYHLGKFYPEWDSEKEPFYWHAIFIGIILLFVVQTAVGFYEHWLYFHGPDHIYHEKYHTKFLQIAESIHIDDDEEEDTKISELPVEVPKPTKNPVHKYRLRTDHMKEDLNKIRQKFVGAHIPEPPRDSNEKPEDNKNKIWLYPGQHSRV